MSKIVKIASIGTKEDKLQNIADSLQEIKDA